jgi:hypothetical protein
MTGTSTAEVLAPQKRGRGRPEGSTSKSISRRKINELNSRDDSPMDVMADNLIFWHRKVRDLDVEMSKMLAHLDPSDVEDRREFMRLLQTIIDAREKSQAVAVDMAPYCHPKLQAIAIQSLSQTKVIVEGGLPEMPE